MPDRELLLALDMCRAGKSQREIGLALRKNSRIPKRGWPDSHVRSLARRRIEKANWTMRAGYLAIAMGV